MKFLSYLSAAAITLSGLTASAQTTAMPEVVMPIQGESIILSNMSDNGKWAVSETGSKTEGDIRPSGGVIFNMETLEQTDISDKSGLSGVADITNDGDIVVGEFNNKPGYWSKSKGGWTAVKTPAGYDLGRLNAVTPDGRYAVGYCTMSKDPYQAYPLAYDLKEGKEIELPNMPTLDMNHENMHQNVLYDITPDGRYIVGQLSQSYLQPVAMTVYVYDRENNSVDHIGFTPDDIKPWTPLWKDLYFIDAPRMSNNGEWVTGKAYMVHPIPGSEWANEGYCTFRYHIPTKKIEVYDDPADADSAGFAVADNGMVYASTPAENPYSSTIVRSGNYFISLDQIFKQVYHYDYNGITGYQNTGKVMATSTDGKTLILIPNTDSTYILRLPEPLWESAKRVNLLGSYQVYPAEGMKYTELKTITLTFDRNVKVRGAASGITVKSADGSESFTPISTNGLVADGKKVTITFRPKKLKKDVEYTLNIPAGLIRLDGDEEIASDEINVKYIGRGEENVKCLSIAPEDGAYVSMLDVATSPILLTFDADLKLAEAPRAYLYKNDSEEPFCDLNVAVQDCRALLFPTSGQHLYDGDVYSIKIPQGTLTDISGAGANEEINFTYHGNYIRQLNETKYILGEECDNYIQVMMYDGDKREPQGTVVDWGFTKENTPWLIVRDAESTDMAFASHSMYMPAGQADDWMVFAQVMIPDDKCYLEFDAQSYLYGCNDKLDVFIYPCENVYNTVDKDIIEDIRTKGDHVFSETLEPGDSEEELEGDWKHYTVDMAKYAGKEVYIAFANLNRDESAVFVDKIHVVHDMVYLTTFDTPSRVVNKNEVIVEGELLFDSELETFSSIALTLTDAEGTRIDEIKEDGLELKKGVTYDFKFDNPVKLKLGEITTYIVEVSLDGETPAKFTGKVANLTEQHKRHIVLEEYTGSECGNCPMGVRGMENIESLYPEVMIPIAIRTYQNDRLNSGQGAYSQFLGLDNLGAPSAILNRDLAGYPMYQTPDGDYRFSGAGTFDSNGKENVCWLDIFRKIYEVPVDVAVAFTSEYDEATGKVTAKVHINNALNQYKAAYNLFAVVTEDGLPTYQKNYMTAVTDPDLGEWGAGGKYGSSTVMVNADHVARQTWGTTYNGTPGHFPSTMKAGEVYSSTIEFTIPEKTITDPKNCNLVVMLIDAGLNQVINANTCKLSGGMTPDAVESITGDAEANIGMTVVNGSLYVNAPGKYHVAAYDLTGAIVLNAAGEGTKALPLNGYNGVLIVKVSDENGNAKSAKFIVR